MKTAAAVAATAVAVRASARAFAAFLSDAPTAAERHRDAEGVDVDDGGSMARASGVVLARRDAAKGVRASGDSARGLDDVVGGTPRAGMSTSGSREEECCWTSDTDGSERAGTMYGDIIDDGARDKEETPNFFASTKFFSVLELELSRELFEASEELTLGANSILFRQGDESSSGIYIVVQGSVGVYLQAQSGSGAPPLLTNILQEGESVGDIDVLDGDARSVSCIAMEDGARVVRVSQSVFLDFVRRHPHTLQLYLQQAIARLWRVAQFSLIDFLGMPRKSLKGQPEADDACALTDSKMLEHMPVFEKYCERRVFFAGEPVFEENVPTEEFYILVKGSIVREAVPWPKGDGVRGAPVRALQLLGAAHFMTRSPFRENQSAAEDCEVLVVTGEILDTLCAKEIEAYIALLRQASSSLGVLIRNFIGFGLNRVWLRSGEHVFLVDEDATSMFIIISGRVRLKQSRRQKFDVVRERGRGDTIGEAPLLAHGKYSSTAVTSRDTELVRMSHGALTIINAYHAEVSSRLLELVACKLQNNFHGGDRAHAELVTICLIPADGATQIDSFASALQQALSLFGSTLLLDKSSIDETFADGTTERLDNLFYRSKLTGWMAQQEEVHRFIVLQADAHTSSWSKVCASQADCVLVVAHADRTNSTPLMHEQRLIWRTRNSARSELVLIHEPGSTPHNTHSWRKNRSSLARHHHVRLSAKEDMARLARYISGHSVGVILTGGGGGGLAHLGALRALEENGIPIDCIGGTSQGTLTAGMYARSLSTSHMLPMLRENMHVLSSPHHLLTDLTLPLLSLFSGKGLDGVVKSSVGTDTEIEDLWLNFFCCSTNLTKGCLTVHKSGLLWRSIRASMTVLGLLPPVRDENNELLVDGGYLNSVPVDVMRTEMGVETVIVIDVEDKDFISFRDLTPHDRGISGFGLLWDRLNPFGMGKTKEKNLDNPSYADVLSALTATTTKQHLEKLNRDHRINLHLRPPGVSAWMANALTVQQMDAAVRKSQAYTNKAIIEWKIQATELNSNDSKCAVESDLQIAASEVGHVSVPMSPPLSPSRVKKPSSLPDSTTAPALTSTHQYLPPGAPAHIQVSKHAAVRLGKPSHNRAAHIPSHEVDASPSSPAPASQLVRTFTDQSTTANDPAVVDPAVFLAASSVK